MKRYLVVVNAPAPAKPDHAASYTVATPPQVKFVTAQTAEAALATVRIEPGGHAFVVDELHVQRFDKAREAPLVRVGTDGLPLPKAMPANAC